MGTGHRCAPSPRHRGRSRWIAGACSLAFATVAVFLVGAILAGTAGSATARATSAFASQTDKECGYCHAGSPGGELTPEGEAFVAAGYELPPSTSVTPTVAPTEPGSGGAATTASIVPPGGEGDDGESAGMLVSLPEWLRVLMLWAHLAAAVAWLGAIIFVHIVQTPAVAGQGIPRGYLKLAWPSIITIGVTGVFMTLNSIDTLAVLDDTRWGRILLAKIAFYLALASVATVATFVISPRLKHMAERARRPIDSQETYKEQGIITIAYQGCVYDVSRSRLWRGGRHAKRHDAWQDLTEALAGAPHGPEVFESFTPLEGVAETSTPAPLKVFMLLAYGNLALIAGVLAMVALW